ncbi:tetratricopeptide repeat protein [Chloroflexota bacterium]
MNPTQDKQEPQAPVSQRNSRGFTILFLGLAVLTASYLLAPHGVSTLYNSRGSISLSRGLAASEPQEQDALLRQASTLFREALRWNPDNGRAYYNLGRIYLAREQKPAAQEAFERVVDLVPHDPYANDQLGFLYDGLGQHDDALKAWREAGNAPGLVRQGLLCRAQALDDCAERFYKLALNVQPDYADAYYSLAMLYAAQGRETEAVKAYRDALRFPFWQSKKRYLAQARLLSYDEQWDDAIVAYQQIIEEDPHNADAYVQIGSILLRQYQDESGAIDWYLAAMEAEPQSAMPYLRLANLHWAQQDCSQAEQWYKGAAAVAGEKSEALARAQMGLSRCARQRGNLEAALRAAQAAVDAQPATAIYHVLLADQYAELKLKELAIVSYQTVLTLDPYNKRARRQLDALGWQKP